MSRKQKKEMSEVEERAHRAVRNAQKCLPQWRSLVRVLARDSKINVRLSATQSCTDGTTVHIKVPVTMGDTYKHDLSLCGQRDEIGKPMCVACFNTEDVNVSIFHEVAHIIEDSIEFLSSDDTYRFIKSGLDLLIEDDDKRQKVLDFVQEKLTHPKYNGRYNSAMGVATILNEWLPLIVNVFEDIRVNGLLIKARPGIAKMFEWRFLDVLMHGVEGIDGVFYYPKDKGPEGQLIFAAFFAGHGYDMTPGTDLASFYDEKVIDDLNDMEPVMAKCQDMGSVRGAFHLALEFLIEGRKRGYFEDKEDPFQLPPPPQPEDAEEGEGDPGEGEGEDSGDADGEDSDKGDGPGMSGGSGEMTKSDSGSGGQTPEQQPQDGQQDEETGADDQDDEQGSDSNSGDQNEDDEDEHDSPSQGGDGESDEESDDEGQDQDGSGSDSEEEADSSEADDSDSTEGANGEPELNSPEDIKRMLEKISGHSLPEEIPDEDKNRDGEEVDLTKADDEMCDEDDMSVLRIAVNQAEFFEGPAQGVLGVKIHTDPNNLPDGSDGWLSERQLYRAPEIVIGPEIIGPANRAMRKAFIDNQTSHVEGGRRRGPRLDAKTMGRRIPTGDPFIFAKRETPDRKDHAVLIGMDISGSTWRDVGDQPLVEHIKAMGYAQTELCVSTGVKTAVYAHTGWQWVEMYKIKGFTQRWGPEEKMLLRRLTASSANLDGHTLEFYRKQIEGVNATSKTILYFTDGAMPLANFDEELEILQREIKYCKQRGINLVGIGVGTDSPTRHGLDTIRCDRVEDIPAMITQLKSRLI